MVVKLVIFLSHFIALSSKFWLNVKKNKNICLQFYYNNKIGYSFMCDC